MFYIDGISLNKIKDELKENLLGKKINKITKNTEVSLFILEKLNLYFPAILLSQSAILQILKKVSWKILLVLQQI